MHLQENLTFFLGPMSLKMLLSTILNHVIYATAKFEVAMIYGLRGDAFSRKYII